ncbi:MAG: hypothetical protein MET45_10430 [Nostoc sp. LLA-1]|nr:hypothetical protein [Cyanocohniella sp. LLY]
MLLTGVLSVGSGLTLIRNATANSANLTPEISNLVANRQSNRLPRPVANAVRRDLARRQRIPIRELKISDYSQQTWRNGCLELPQPNELCTQALVPGWRVVVTNGKQNWTYHTNNNGRSLRLATANAPTNPSANLPPSVRNAVLQAASQRLQQPISRLNIMQFQQQTWTNGCLNLPGVDENCSEALVGGWRVIVGAVDQTLVYHTNHTGSVVRLNEQASEITAQQPPQNVRNAVLQAASKRLQQPIARLNIMQSQQQTWTNGCLDLAGADEFCTQALVPGWRVIVGAVDQTLIYHTNQTGSAIRLNEQASEITGQQLPQNIRNAVLQAASRHLQQPISRLSIMQAQQQTWRDGCLELGNINELCLAALVPGWRVIVGAADQNLIYHTNETGSVVKLNEKANQVTNIQLPQNVKNAVLQAASNRVQQPVSRLTITQAQQRNWSGGCLELANPGEGCTRNIVAGWRVVVNAMDSTLVYHTNQTGSAIRLNEQASKISNNQ